MLTKVTAQQDRQTDRRIDRQTDTRTHIIMPHLQTVIKINLKHSRQLTIRVQNSSLTRRCVAPMADMICVVVRTQDCVYPLGS